MTHFNFCSLKTNLREISLQFFNVPSKFSLKNSELSREIVLEIRVCYSMASENISISKYQSKYQPEKIAFVLEDLCT